MKAVLGFGGNLGVPLENIRSALTAVSNLCGTRLLRLSRYYLSEAVEVSEAQPSYINCAAEIETELSPHALLGTCLGIESALGRTRPGYKSPRTVDIDLLLYEGVSLESKELTVPHPGILRRAFVLLPLSDLYPNASALGLDYSCAIKDVSGQSIELFIPDDLTMEL